MFIILGLLWQLVVRSSIVASAFVTQGLVLSKLWDWFIVPLNKNIPTLTVVSAIGVTIVIGYLTSGRIISRTNDEEDDFFDSAIMHPLIVLFVGWCLRFFM
jgi:hypothetical protein